MKKLITFISLAVAAVFPSFSADHKYIVNVVDEHQTHEGWGVSLCWWANMCGKWDDQKIDEIVDWLVSEDGLNYNIFRYNIPGGDDPENRNCSLHHMASGKGIRAEMEGFKSYDGDSYHWERDAAQRKIMLKIKEKRPDAIFEAFSNSAPYYMTYSGCCAGNTDGSKDNLKPEYYTAFANYLVDVCKHYKNTYGIEFRTLDPFNEPNTNYWSCGGGQEGCHFDPSSQVEFIKVIYPILKQSGLSTELSACDETSVNTAVSEIKTYISGGVLDKVAQWNVHTYEGNIKDRCQLATLARTNGKRFWMSETGMGGNGIAGHLDLAQRLIDDIEYLRPDAWVDWQYIEEWNDHWCLVRGEFENQYYWKVKNYYVRQHFSKYIKPGYTFVTAMDAQTVAAVSTDRKKLVIVSINNTDEAATHYADIFGCHIENGTTAYITTESSDGKELATSIDGRKLSFTLEPRSIATIEVPIFIYPKDYTPVPVEESVTYLIVPQYNKTQLLFGGKGQNNALAKIDFPNPNNESWNWYNSCLIGNQIWLFTNGNDDSYKIKTSQWEEYLTDTGEYYLSVDWWKDDSSQQFTVEPIYGNLVRIVRTGYSDKRSLDLEGENYGAGTSVGLWGYGSDVSACHRNWYLMRLPEPSDPTSVEQIKLPKPYRVTSVPGSIDISSDSEADIRVFTPDGKTVATAIGSKQTKFCVSRGMYLISVTTNGNRYTEKVIVR